MKDGGDLVFKALPDPTRRHLLDRLFKRDGWTLTELKTDLVMSRFGVMKHLRMLEEAGLVTTRRSGRQKLHFLDPVPIRLIYDRWIDKFTERQVWALTDLKPLAGSPRPGAYRSAPVGRGRTACRRGTARENDDPGAPWSSTAASSTTSTVTPDSSRTSRATASRGDSPTSHHPPGRVHRPSDRSWTSSTRPSASNTAPRTSTFGVAGALSGGDRRRQHHNA